MPGLLDFLDSDEGRMGIGLLMAGSQRSDGAGFGQRLGEGMNYVQTQKENDAKRRFQQVQMDNYNSEIEARKLAGVKDARQQATMDKLMNGDGNSEAMSPGAFSPSSDGMGPVMSFSAPQAQQGVQGGLMGYARSIGIPEKAIQSEMAFSGGKGIAEMLFKRGTPNMKVANGYAYDENTLGAGFMPSLSTSTNGQTSMTQIGPDRMPVVSAPQGALATFGAYKGMETGLGAAAKVNLRKNADGTESPVSELTENPTLQNLLTGRPAASGAQPGYVTEPQMKATMRGDMGVNPAALEREIKAVQNDLMKPIDEGSKSQLRAHLEDLQRQAANSQVAKSAATPAPTGYGMTNQQTAQAEANKALAVESSKSGNDRIMKGYDGAQTAADSIISNAEARKSLAGGSFLGSGAETKLAITKAIQGMGFDVAADKVTNTDYLQSTLGQGILNKAKTLGANPTDNDARIIKNIVGSIGTDPMALEKLLNHQDVMSNRAIDQHNKNYSDAKTRGFDAGFDLTVSGPDGAAKAGNKTPTDFKSAGYADKAAAIRDANNAIMRGASREAVQKRLQSMGLSLPSGAQGSW